jgi:short-subunit dehydrogenase
LITGCSSGIGEALCLAFHARGCTVIATARRPESLQRVQAAGVQTLRLDVTDRTEIAQVVCTVLESNGRIDILINNAGYGLIKPAIDLQHDELRAQLETNFLAPLALAQAVSPSMKHNGQGKIVNIGSISGIVTTPFSGAYCASKAALHSLSDALRMELKPFGLQVITVQPGAIRSHFGKTAAATAQQSIEDNSWYHSLQNAINQRAEVSQQNATSAQDFAERLTELLLKERPPSTIRLGKHSTFLPLLQRLLPQRMLDKVLMKRFGLDALEISLLPDRKERQPSDGLKSRQRSP